jgi:hypothetical protein
MSAAAGDVVSGKRLLFVTGTRADFGKLEPLAKAAQDAGFLISFFITGMHMMKRYGETRLVVRNFAGAEFFEFVNQRFVLILIKPICVATQPCGHSKVLKFVWVDHLFSICG